MALAPSSNDTYRFDFEYGDNSVTKTDVELIKFTATETISRPYEYSITVKPNATSDTDVYNILNLECRIKIYIGPSTGPDLSFTHIKTISGVVVDVEDADYHGNDAYIVRMIPKLGLLEKVRNNTVFIDRYLADDSLTRLTIRMNALRACDLATRELLFNSLRLFSARAHRSVVLISSDDSSLQRQIVVAVRAFVPSVDLAFDSL